MICLTSKMLPEAAVINPSEIQSPTSVPNSSKCCKCYRERIQAAVGPGFCVILEHPNTTPWGSSKNSLTTHGVITEDLRY
jgi:hypothetical protein